MLDKDGRLRTNGDMEKKAEVTREAKDWTTRTVNVRMPVKLVAALQDRADAEFRTVASLIRELVAAGLAQGGKKG